MLVLFGDDSIFKILLYIVIENNRIDNRDI